MDLRIMGALFDKLILGNVCQHSGDTSKEKQCRELFTCIKDEIGLNIKKVNCPVNKVESNWLSLNHYSMNGPDSHKFKEKKGWVKALDIVMPLESRERDPFLQQKYDKAFKIFELWSTKLWPLINDRSLEKNEKAAQVDVMAVEFVEMFKDTVGTTTHLYPHLLVAHLADQMRDLPCDIFFFQTQGLEHRHKQRKLVMIGNCNKHKPKAPSKHNVAAHEKKNGKVTMAYEQNSGTSRQQQSLEHSVVKDHINTYNQNHCRKAQEEALQQKNKRLSIDAVFQEEQQAVKRARSALNNTTLPSV
jgi:hypothetical protein